MDLHQLRCALAVVDHGGFTRAARALHLSQSALSHSVRRLEADLGTPLFERVGRRVPLTAAGEAFVGPARRALAAAEGVRGAVGAVTGLLAGRLELVVLRSLVVPVAALVAALRAEAPGVVVGLRDPDENDNVLARVRAGEGDLGLARGAAVPADLEGRVVAHEEYVAVLPPGTPPARRVGPAALGRHPLVAPQSGGPNRALFDRMVGSDRATVAVETDHLEAAVALAAAGAGATVAPAALAPLARALGAVTAPLAVDGGGAPVLAVHRPGALSPAGAAFLALVDERGLGTGRDGRAVAAPTLAGDRRPRRREDR